MKLISEATGNEVRVGDVVTTFRNEKCKVIGFREPHKPGSTGLVFVKMSGHRWEDQFFPSVIGAKFVD